MSRCACFPFLREKLFFPEIEKRIVILMKNKHTIKVLKKVHRDLTKSLDLSTRIARTEKPKKDAKIARRKWKQKGEI